MIQQFDTYPILTDNNVIPDYFYSSLRDKAMHDLGVGTMRDMDSVITGIFFPVMQCRGYTLPEKINIWRAKAFSNNAELFSTMLETDISETVPELEIPVYFFSGLHDYTVSYRLAKEYLDAIGAPQKGFYTFEASAHSPLFEEPERAIEILRTDILAGIVTLADNK